MISLRLKYYWQMNNFPTDDVSFKQIVADFSPNIAAVPHGLESTGTKLKTTTTTQRTKTKQQIFQDFM